MNDLRARWVLTVGILYFFPEGKTCNITKATNLAVDSNPISCRGRSPGLWRTTAFLH